MPLMSQNLSYVFDTLENDVSSGKKKNIVYKEVGDFLNFVLSLKENHLLEFSALFKFAFTPWKW